MSHCWWELSQTLLLKMFANDCCLPPPDIPAPPSRRASRLLSQVFLGESGNYPSMIAQRALRLPRPMTESDFKSPAFQTAELHSERVRIFGVLLFLAIVVAVLIFRVFLLQTTVLSSHAIWNLASLWEV